MGQLLKAFLSIYTWVDINLNLANQRVENVLVKSSLSEYFNLNMIGHSSHIKDMSLQNF